MSTEHKTTDAVAAPLLRVLGDLVAERDRAQAAVRSYDGYENSPHYAPWLDRLRLLNRAEAALRKVLANER